MDHDRPRDKVMEGPLLLVKEKDDEFAPNESEQNVIDDGGRLRKVANDESVSLGDLQSRKFSGRNMLNGPVLQDQEP